LLFGRFALWGAVRAALLTGLSALGFIYWPPLFAFSGGGCGLDFACVGFWVRLVCLV